MAENDSRNKLIFRNEVICENETSVCLIILYHTLVHNLQSGLFYL